MSAARGAAGPPPPDVKDAEPSMDPEDLYPPRPKISRAASIALVLGLSLALWVLAWLLVT